MLPETTQGAGRLMEVLEKLSRWAGNDAGGYTPSGMPSDAAVQAFEEALNSPDPERLSVSSAPDGPPGVTTDDAILPGPADVVPSLSPTGDASTGSVAEVQQPAAADRTDMRPEGKTDGLRQELERLLQNISQPDVPVGPESLFRAQYLMGMLKVQAQAGINSSGQVSQGMESVLRRQD